MSTTQSASQRAGFTTQRLVATSHKSFRSSSPTKDKWLARWNAFYTNDFVTKAVFLFYAAVLASMGFVAQQLVDSVFMSFYLYLIASGCVWLAINSKKLAAVNGGKKPSVKVQL